MGAILRKGFLETSSRLTDQFQDFLEDLGRRAGPVACVDAQKEDPNKLFPVEKESKKATDKKD